MKWDFKHLLPEDFSPLSKVWIYQANRPFTLQEALETETILEEFSENWISHGAAVKGYANLLFGQFIVLMADETTAHVSGCSTDSSVRMIKSIESRFHINLFDRELLAFLKEDKIQLIPYNQFSYAYSNGFIGNDTLFFNNIVDTKRSMEEKWMVPLRESWLYKKVEKQPSRKLPG